VKNNVIIFGTKQTAQLARFYLENDSKYKVVAFTVHKRFIDSGEFEGLPVVPFEDLPSHFSPEEHFLFAPMTGTKMNELRKNVFLEGKEMGYNYISYISSRATNFASSIGENCFILEDNTLQPFTEIGDNVVLWSGNHIGHHGKIEDHVFFTSHVVMSGNCHVKESAWLGVNATIRDDVTIGSKCLIAMGSLVTKSTEDDSFYMGTPAKLQKKKSYEIL
jgi:sugar O-acyltransferase (sialic acid O-acetyltransferase NeuD family)